MRARHKKWVLPFLAEHPEIALPHIDSHSAFFQAEHLYLEIGIGKGDFIVAMAGKLPGHFLGLERDDNVSGIAARKILESGAENIRIRKGDFDDLASEMAGLRFELIFLNFSDPWPKKKHGKRRLTYAPRLEKIASFLQEGGQIRIKTDNKGLYEFTLEQAALAKLRLLSATENYEFDGEGDAMSEYERNFRKQGNPIYRLIYQKQE